MTDLEFHEIPYDNPNRKEPEPPAHVNISMTDDEEDNLFDANEPQDKGTKETAKHSIFSLGFYQQFFNVNTNDVFTRTWSSMVPNPRKNYLEYSIRPNPDLYGPFWICATLTFFIAITGNVADFFHKSGEGFIWRYDFHKVTLAATVIFAYWLIIPLCIWGFLRWRGNKSGFSLTEIVCVYGYSLAIFIPISVLWLIPVIWVKYLLAAIASLLSGCTLLITLWPAVKNDTKQVAMVFMLLVVLLHAALGTGFVLYFFHYDTTSTPTPNPSNLSNSTALRGLPVISDQQHQSLSNFNTANSSSGSPSDSMKSTSWHGDEPVGSLMESSKTGGDEEDLRLPTSPSKGTKRRSIGQYGQLSKRTS